MSVGTPKHYRKRYTCEHCGNTFLTLPLIVDTEQSLLCASCFDKIAEALRGAWTNLAFVVTMEEPARRAAEFADPNEGEGNTAIQDNLDEAFAWTEGTLPPPTPDNGEGYYGIENESDEAAAGKLLVNGVMYAPEDVTVRNVPEMEATVYVRFLSDDSGVFVKYGEDGYRLLKLLADKADVEAAETFEGMGPGEDSAAARAGRKIIHAATKGETVIYEHSETHTMHKAEYVEDSSEAGTWLRTKDGLTFIQYDQIMGVEKAYADLPTPTHDELLADFKAATQVIAPKNQGLRAEDAARIVSQSLLPTLNVISLEARREDIARLRAALDAEEAKINAEQALSFFIAALDTKNEFYISSLRLKCRQCGASLMLAFAPETTPLEMARLLRDDATAQCDECATNREEQEDDGSIGGADEYGYRGPFEEPEQEDGEDRPPFLDQFNEEAF